MYLQVNVFIIYILQLYWFEFFFQVTFAIPRFFFWNISESDEGTVFNKRRDHVYDTNYQIFWRWWYLIIFSIYCTSTYCNVKIYLEVRNMTSTKTLFWIVEVFILCQFLRLVVNLYYVIYPLKLERFQYCLDQLRQSKVAYF